MYCMVHMVEFERLRLLRGCDKSTMASRTKVDCNHTTNHTKKKENKLKKTLPVFVLRYGACMIF